MGKTFPCAISSFALKQDCEWQPSLALLSCRNSKDCSQPEGHYCFFLIKCQVH